ncbi:MAG: YHS domain-containing protein [Anaerolineae bacterium]|jgi:signal transduction histidine kinase/YHS domain-containing protein|nr:YHS domain-containing protein [Anaerolineae bacterium]
MTDMHGVHVTAIVLSVALFLASNAWFYARVLRPIRRLASQFERMERGEFEALDEACGGVGEVRALQRSMRGMVTHIRGALAQSAAYAEQLSDGQERERKRLARELHDSTVQALIAVGQTAQLAQAWLTEAPDRAAEMLTLARQQAVAAADDLRGLIADLRPPSLEELGLPAALAMLAQRAAVPVQVTVEGAVRRLPEPVELALFRAGQELLTNAARHSGAAQVWVGLRYTPDAVAVTVRDDGRGFEVLPDVRQYALRGHYGLMGVRERLMQVGGEVQVVSGVGEGACITVRVAARAPETGLTRDPVCGMDIAPGRAYATAQYDGQTYAFCCPVCKGAFEREPERYLKEPLAGVGHPAP